MGYMGYYYKKKQDPISRECELIKYGFTYDYEELEKIYHEVVDKCGIRDISEAKYYETGETKISEQTETPKLARLIMMFLGAANSEADRLKLLDYVFGDAELCDDSKILLNIKDRKASIVTKIKSIIDSDDEVNIEMLYSLIDEFKRVQKLIELNKDVNPSLQKDYIAVLKEVITLKEVSKINYDTYVKVMNFSGTKPIC